MDANRSDECKAASTKASHGTALPIDFRPGPFDVVCQRGKLALEHEGNAKFRKLIKDALPKYSDAIHKWEKTGIVTAIIETVKNKSKGGGFVRSVGNRWYRVSDQAAREKIGQTLRDFLHDKYRSSTRAKARRRNTPKGKVLPGDLPDQRSLHGLNADSFTEDSEGQNSLQDEGTRTNLTEELQTNFIGTCQRLAAMDPNHLGALQYSFEQYRNAIGALQNSGINLGGDECGIAGKFTEEDRQTEEHNVSKSSGAGGVCLESPDNSTATADTSMLLQHPSVPSQLDSDLEAALDSVFPPADHEALHKFSISSFEALVQQL